MGEREIPAEAPMPDPLTDKLTEEGVVILFSGDPATGESSCDVFREGESDTDPVAAAEALRDSCEHDFPTRMWSIAANERARELMSQRRMRQWGMPDA